MHLLPALGGEPVGKPFLLALTLVGLGVLALSVVFNEFGMIHFEWWGYVPYHLGPGSIWAKIFDNRALDQGVYAGRELSYLVDHLDMLMVARFVQWGCPLFISVMHVLLCVFIGVWLAWYAARDLKLGSLIGLLLALIFWTTPYVYLHFLMRTAKGLTTVGVVVLMIEIHRACRAGAGRKDAPLSFRHAALVVLSAGVMSFSDRQGFYFLLCAVGIMALEWGLSRTRLARTILLLLVGVLVLELVYFFWIAPALTKFLWGYQSDFSFNQLPLSELLAQPVRYGTQAMELLVQSIGFTLGRMPHWVVAVVVAAVWWIALANDIRSRSWRAHVPVAGLIAAILAGLWVMYMLMILRHPPLLWPDLRTVYYWIPTAALVILGVLVVVGDWVGPHPGRKIALSVLLLALVGANIAALPGHRRVFTGGHLQDSIRLSWGMRDALLHCGDPGYAVPDEIENNAVFRTLREFAPARSYPAIPWEQYGQGEFYQRTRSSGASVRFVEEFGGNVDSRFLSTSGRFIGFGTGHAFTGAAAGPVEMRVNTPSNRLHGELILQRTGADAGVPLAATFMIYAQPHPQAEPRYERWQGRVELPAGEREVAVAYEIDGSGLPTLFTLDIPPESAGRLVAGWRNPSISHVGRDSPAPAWLFRSSAPILALDEAALAKLLPDGWRPSRALMRNGRVTEAGIELSPGGEIWLKAHRIVSKFIGTAVAAAVADQKRLTLARGFWYKAGRLQTYMPPSPGNTTDGSHFFQAWCAEPDGWLVIAADPGFGTAPVLVHVRQVSED